MGKMHPLIQIAGVRNPAEALVLVHSGVTHVGLPLRLPVHREDVSEDQARQIVTALAGKAQAVLITYLTDPRETLVLCRYLGVGGVQLHGGMGPQGLAALKAAAPELFVIKSLVVRQDNAEELAHEAQACAPHCDAFLTDTFDPASGASGATGKVHDWAVSRALAEQLRPLGRPLILAGGLTPGNVAQAIEAVRPAGVDAHTGVENKSGDKDAELVRRFVAEAWRGFRSIGFVHAV